MKNLHLYIKGRVQGVGFRYSAKKVARSFNLSGYVKNMYDNSVYIEVEGDENNLKEFTEWCHRGPEHAIVEQVKVEEGELKNYYGFETRF